MAKIDIAKATTVTGTHYPAPFDVPCRARVNTRLGVAADLTQFGVNLTRLPPGAWSSQRHWHTHEDEFIYVLEGEVTLVTDAGEEVLRAGDCAGFKGGVRDGHHLQNRSTDREARMLVVGTRDDRDHGEYPDVDLAFKPGRYSGGGGFTHKDGRPY